ncbi:hypothetical protein WISP_03083 [Willisornis vidua]|uniref:Uncharacterized protein n=1 Tax=Willisornis vidua TaxID=1566151 RepID=A0ABQ9DTS5_9PASS|nr:hypothetical protein WISP_03083 [Willisornis vidua]
MRRSDLLAMCLNTEQSIGRALMKAARHWYLGSLHRQTDMLLSAVTALFNTPPAIKGLSPILPPKNGKNDSMTSPPQGTKRNNLLDFILFCSEVFCGSNNSPFKGKTETATTTRFL